MIESFQQGTRSNPVNVDMPAKTRGLASCEKPAKTFAQINLYHIKIMTAVLYHKICFE